MSVETEGKHTGEFLLSEAPGSLSREQATLKGGNSIDVGDPLMWDNGKLAKHDGALDTDNNVVSAVAGFAWAKVDATLGDVKNVVYIARDAEIRDSSITYPVGANKKAAILESAALLHIIAR